MRKATAFGDPQERDPQLFYEVARDRLNVQLSLLDALDNKVISLVGFGSTLLGILGAVIALHASGTNESIGAVEIVLLIAATVDYVVVVWKVIEAYFCRSIDLGPEIRKTWNAMWSDGEDDAVKWRVARSYWEKYEENRPIQETKSNALPSMLVGVIIQSFLVVLALGWVAVAA
jgi:hypothetical protein